MGIFLKFLMPLEKWVQNKSCLLSLKSCFVSVCVLILWLAMHTHSRARALFFMEIDIYDPCRVFWSQSLALEKSPSSELLKGRPSASLVPPSLAASAVPARRRRAGGMTTKEGLFPRGSSVVRMKMRSEGRGEEMEKWR